jgi:hypothetical protein
MVKHDKITYKKITSCGNRVEPKNLGSFCTITNANRKSAFKNLPTLAEERLEA